MKGALLAAWCGVLACAASAQTPPSTATGPRTPGSEAQALTLEQAHELALRNHPDIAAANYRAQAAHEAFVQTRAGLLPQLSLYGSAVHADSANTRLMAGAINNPSVFSRTAVGGGLTQLITDFGHSSNLLASSQLQASAEAHNASSTREQVLLQVDHGYFSTLKAQAVLAVARQTLDTRRLLLERVSVLAQNKLRSDLDVSFAQVGVEDARLLVQQARNEVDSSMATLSTVLGSSEQQRFTLAEETPASLAQSGDVAQLVEKALRDRPELASLRDQRDAAQSLARSLRDARLPSISAVIDAGNSPSHDARLPANYSAGGIVLSMPVFAGGLYEARQHEAELRARAAAESLRTLENNVSRDVRIAWLDLNNARDRVRTTAQLARYAATGYELADARYKVGSSSIVELSQAQLELTSAQIAESTARYEVLIREADLNYEVGSAAGADAGAPPPPP